MLQSATGITPLISYNEIKCSTQDTLYDLLIQYYQEDYDGYYGQVLYYRYMQGGSCFSQFNLYPGNNEIQYAIEFADPISNKVKVSNQFFRFVMEAYKNNNYDPVLR